MEGTVNVPVVGKQKKQTAYAVGAVAGLVAIVAIYRSRKAKSAAASTAATDPSIDPATGIPWAQEQAAGGGSNFSGGIPPASGTGSGTVFTDNAQWSQYAESYLTGLGGDPQVTGRALGKYITGQEVDTSQQAIIEQAIAFAGYPPVSGPGGFPPSIRLGSGNPPPPPPPPPPDKDITVPDVAGHRVEDASAILRRAGLKASFGARKTHIEYVVSAQNPKAGAQAEKGSTVRLTIRARPSGHLPKRPVE